MTTFLMHLSIFFVMLIIVGFILIRTLNVLKHKAKLELSKLIINVTRNRKAVQQLEEFTKETIFNNIEYALNKEMDAILNIPATSKYSKGFVTFLREIDITKISKIYFSLRKFKTFKTAAQALRSLNSGHVLSADIHLLLPYFQYLKKTVKGSELKSYPKPFLAELTEIAIKADEDFIQILETFGDKELYVPTLKNLVLKNYISKISKWQVAYYRNITYITKTYRDTNIITDLIRLNNFEELFERLKEMDLDKDIYQQVVLAEAQYNDLKLSKADNSISEEHYDIRKTKIIKLLQIINKTLNDNKKIS